VALHAAQRQGSDLEELLSRGAAELGVILDVDQRRKLLDYLDLLVKWNAVYNLTSVREPAQMLTTHLLDSLAIVPLIRELGAERVLDVGSGAGLPGIPLAIASPELAVTLVDAVQKKVAFLNQVKGSLMLQISPIHIKVQALTSSEGYDCITSRAFSSLSEFAASSAHLLAPRGVLVALKARVPLDEIRALPAGFSVARIIELHVPGLDAQRCAVVLENRGARAPL
jgi:16S rRNA (guanine527-N7)-methyltransferase